MSSVTRIINRKAESEVAFAVRREASRMLFLLTKDFIWFFASQVSTILNARGKGG
jgi:hypothetical protein